MGVHDGHREKMRRRFLETGLDSFAEHEALELLLFYAIPRRDTNEIAHMLLNRFGSLEAVFAATVEELQQIDGIGENAAVLLKLAPELLRYYQVDKVKEEMPLVTIQACGDYLKHFFLGRKNETVFLLCLDAKCKVLACREVGEGSVNSAGISIRKIVEMALAANATSVVLAHNHPSGLALPSPEDIHTTRRVAAALQAVDVHLADHIVVADGDYVSLVQSGYRFDDLLLP